MHYELNTLKKAPLIAVGDNLQIEVVRRGSEDQPYAWWTFLHNIEVRELKINRNATWLIIYINSRYIGGGWTLGYFGVDTDAHDVVLSAPIRNDVVQFDELRLGDIRNFLVTDDDDEDYMDDQWWETQPAMPARMTILSQPLPPRRPVENFYQQPPGVPAFERGLELTAQEYEDLLT